MTSAHFYMPIEAAVRTESSAVRFRENDSDYNYINSIRQASGKMIQTIII